MVLQAIVDLCTLLFFFSLGTGVLEDPFFGSYWWEEYRRWMVAFALALVAGSAICLYAHWILSFLLACGGAGLFLTYYKAACADFESCNLLAFLGFGFMIAFLLPTLVAISIAIILKLLGPES